MEGGEVGCKIVLGDVAPSVGAATANYASVNIDGNGNFKIRNLLKFDGNNMNICIIGLINNLRKLN